MWFVLALLIFETVYALCRRFAVGRAEEKSEGKPPAAQRDNRGALPCGVRAAPVGGRLENDRRRVGAPGLSRGIQFLEKMFFFTSIAKRRKVRWMVEAWTTVSPAGRTP